MVDALSLLTYMTVTGNIGALITDGVDADTLPDDAAVTGTVTFTPTVTVIRIRGGGADKPKTRVLRPIVATIDSQLDLSVNGVKSVKLVAFDNPYLGFDLTKPLPGYVVSYQVALDGQDQPIPSMPINTVGGTTKDIAELVPVTISNGTLTIGGPPGPEGPTGDGSVDSVNGKTLNVLLTADDIPATATRLYLTPAERQAIAGIVNWSQAQIDARATAVVDARTDFVKMTGNQTIAGVKTFQSAPAVPDNSFTTSKINGLAAWFVARMKEWGQLPIIRFTSISTLRNVPTGYTTTDPVIWDSSDIVGGPVPTNKAEGDYIDDRLA